MRWRILSVTMVGLVAVFSLLGCASDRRPQPGDTVTPKLDGRLIWTAGDPGQLAVRLVAQGKDDARPRLLDFSGVPTKVNPVGTIQFYEGDSELSTLEVKLSHRC